MKRKRGGRGEKRAGGGGARRQSCPSSRKFSLFSDGVRTAMSDCGARRDGEEERRKKKGEKREERGGEIL